MAQVTTLIYLVHKRLKKALQSETQNPEGTGSRLGAGMDVPQSKTTTTPGNLGVKKFPFDSEEKEKAEKFDRMITEALALGRQSTLQNMLGFVIFFWVTIPNNGGIGKFTGWPGIDPRPKKIFYASLLTPTTKQR